MFSPSYHLCYIFSSGACCWSLLVDVQRCSKMTALRIINKFLSVMSRGHLQGGLGGHLNEDWGNGSC